MGRGRSVKSRKGMDSRGRVGGGAGGEGGQGMVWRQCCAAGGSTWKQGQAEKREGVYASEWAGWREIGSKKKAWGQCREKQVERVTRERAKGECRQ